MPEYSRNSGPYQVVSLSRDIQGEVRLPGSKSESTRALMIAAYGGLKPCFGNLSAADDTVLLQNLLNHIASANGAEPCTLDCGNAGTVCRFLLTYLAQRPGKWVLTGSERLKQRPIEPLVTALRTLGADIHYADNQGGLPLLVEGRSIAGGVLHLDGSLSSQFASSLLLAAPTLKYGLELHLDGELPSLPYIDLTLSMMRHFGAEALRDGRVVVVRPVPYVPKPFHVSADWSSASYWYEIAALSQHCDIMLDGLDSHTLQGDAVIKQWAENFGVTSSSEEAGVRLTKTPIVSRHLDFDFSATPDLFPAVTATCAALRLEASFSGLSSLALKESDRLHSMMTELAKIGAFFDVVSSDRIALRYHDGNNCVSWCCKNNDDFCFHVYSDHRLAMALAPLAMLTGRVIIDDVSVVSKSYPDYWKDLEMLNVASLQ